MEHPVSDFPRDSSRADGIGLRCKPCGKAYYAANASKIQKQHKQYKDRNYITFAEYKQLYGERHFFMSKARNLCGAGEKRTPAIAKTVEVAQLWKKQRGICALSGRRLDRNNAQIDHIQAKANGGSNDISNLRWVHRDVNHAKRILSDEAFLQLCLDVVRHHESLKR
jgi:hypothetical protein